MNQSYLNQSLLSPSPRQELKGIKTVIKLKLRKTGEVRILSANCTNPHDTQLTRKTHFIESRNGLINTKSLINFMTIHSKSIIKIKSHLNNRLRQNDLRSRVKVISRQ